MSEGLNRVMLLGNLGADPELRYTQGGQAVLHLRLATTESYLDKDKVRRERTDWHNVVVWGKRGEALARILRRGSTILVEGSLRTSSYEKNGEKRYRTEVAATNIVLPPRGNGGGSRPDDDFAEPQHGPQDRGSTQTAPPADDYAPTVGGYGGDDDIPFSFIGAAPETDGIPRGWL